MKHSPVHLSQLESNDVLRERPRIRRTTLWLGLGGLALVLLIGFLAMALGTNSVAVRAGDIEIAEVRHAPFQATVSATATVESLQSASVTAGEAGTVVRILHTAGDRVAAGTPLFELANPQLLRDVSEATAQFGSRVADMATSEGQQDDRLETARAAMLEAEYRVRTLRRDFELQRGLGERGIVAPARIRSLEDDLHFAETVAVTARRNFEAATRRSTIRSREDGRIRDDLVRQRNLQQLRLESLIVRAPVDGVLSELSANLGSPVAANQAVGRIDDDRAVRIAAQVPAALQAQVRAGARVEIDGVPGLTGSVQSVDQTVRNDEVRAIVSVPPGAARQLRVGQTLTVRIQAGGRRIANVVRFGNLVGPARAFVLNADSSAATATSISLGDRSGPYVEISRGLEAGNRIVIESAIPVQDADRLEIRQ